MLEQVVKNRYGYYELLDKPTEVELQDYYANKYYQQDMSSYSKSYSLEELSYINNKIDQKYAVISNLLPIKGSPYRMLDVGCGEGWALRNFKDKGWEVLGIDYSDSGCRTHNANLIVNLKVGDIYLGIQEIIDSEQQFDLIWLDNVLEHVLDPESLLRLCRKMISDSGILLIEVPNDFSIIQQYLLEKELIPKPFWIAIPDHISYFNRSGLISLCATQNWEYKMMLADFPIDLDLFSENSNYVFDQSNGFSSHKKRIEIENLLHGISVEKTNELYQILAEMGIGRQITGFFQGSDCRNE